MYIYINDTKLTEAEWNETHANDVENNFYDWNSNEWWHMNSYAEYSADFDKQMENQINTRNALRIWYKELMGKPFDDDWAMDISDFNELFKDCFGRSSWFFKDMLKAKGVTYDDVVAAWDRWENRAV